MLKMSELKLAILPFGEIKNFNINGIVQYIQPMAIIDGESGEKHCFEFPFIGKNTDPDKASGAAITYALKYVLNLIALLPDESLDPDTTENSKQNSVKAVNPQPNFNKQIQEIIKNDDEAKATLKIILNFKDIKSLNELSDKEKQEFIKKWGTN
jgi:hypothetical protein